MKLERERERGYAQEGTLQNEFRAAAARLECVTTDQVASVDKNVFVQDRTNGSLREAAASTADSGQLHQTDEFSDFILAESHKGDRGSRKRGGASLPNFLSSALPPSRIPCSIGFLCFVLCILSKLTVINEQSVRIPYHSRSFFLFERYQCEK